MDDPNRDQNELPPEEPESADPRSMEETPVERPEVDETPPIDTAAEEPDFSSTWIPAEEESAEEELAEDFFEADEAEAALPDAPEEAADWVLEADEAGEEADWTDEAAAAGLTAAAFSAAGEETEPSEIDAGAEETLAREAEPVEGGFEEMETVDAPVEPPTGEPPAGEEPSQDKARLYNWLLVILGVLFVISICFLGYLFFGTRGEQPAETPTATPTTTVQPEASDPAWDRIQASGRVVSGTSGDYPPFAFYNETFQLDGLDVALLNEVSRRLGYQSVVQDIAFDGLQNALAVGQIDLAAAAISRTPEREQVVAFSDVYYSSEDAYLAREGAGITVNTIQDLAGKRVAVERSTIYETWARDNLVTPGLIRQDQLLVYHQIDPAVNDLRQERADVVILDLNVANEYLAAGGLVLAGKGLNPQYYAIAMQPSSTVLLANVNQAIGAMQQDGTLDTLIRQYLGQTSGVIPPAVTPTQAPPPPTPTLAPCIDAMEFIDDINYDDQNMTNPPVLFPGERFTKGWRIRNTGTCTWDSSYRMVYVGGNVPAAQMGGVPTPIVGTVSPGAVYDMYVQLTAPSTTGVFQGFWQLQNGSGLNFGARVWVGIFVSPTGEIPTENPPVIQQFVVNPLEINTGSCVSINWQVEGQITNIRLQVNGQDLQANAPTSGGLQDCPGAAGTYEYRLQAAGPGGDTAQSRAVVVRDEAPTPAPPQPEPPVINSFTAQPASVNVGQCTDLNWNVTGDAELVRILRNGELAFDTLPAEGFGQDCFQNRGQVLYELQATGAGQTVTAQQQVTVNLVASYELVELLNSEEVLAGLLPNTRLTLEINNDQIGGSGGCNTYTASYTINGEELNITPPVSTQQACEPPEVMAQEARFFELLDAANRFNVTGDRLELILLSVDPNTRQPVETVLLVFSALVPSPR